MKPFNIERALAGDPIVTRSGRKIIEIHVFEKCKKNIKIIALLQTNNEFDDFQYYLSDGINYHHEDDLDLFMDTKKKKGWININTDDIGLDDMPSIQNRIFKSKEDAISGSLFTKMKQIEIEWE